MLTVPGADGCEQLVDDGDVANLLMYEGTELEPESVIEETTTGVLRPREMAAKGDLLCPAINVYACRHSLSDGIMRATDVNVCVTKSKVDRVYGCLYSRNDGITCATDVMIGGNRALACGYGVESAQIIKTTAVVFYNFFMIS